MIQRIRRSRLLPSLVAALVAATMAGGVASAVTEAKADETITMCVSALGTKIRFVHTSADCNSGELVRTWNVEGRQGPRGLRGNTGATGPTGPTGPSGPSGAAGVSASSFSGGQVIDAAQAVPWYASTGVAAASMTLATSGVFTVPNASKQYFVHWTTTEVIPDATAGCTDNAASAPAVQVLVNGAVTAIPENTLTGVVLPAGSNTILVRGLQGVCTAGTAEAGGTSNVTLARLSVIMG